MWETSKRFLFLIKKGQLLSPNTTTLTSLCLLRGSLNSEYSRRPRKWLTILSITVNSLTPDNFFGIDAFTVFFREYDDLIIFVIGGAHDNELIISEVLNTLHECFDSIFPRGINRKNLTDNMLPVIMIFDELIDEGIIMSLDTDVIIERINEKKGSKILT